MPDQSVTKRGAALCGMILMLGFGCALPVEVGSQSGAIEGTNTVVDSNVSPEWPSVVRLDTTIGSCSGTMISPVHVLTAGHCIPVIGGYVRLDTPQAGGTGPLWVRKIEMVGTTVMSTAAGQDDIRVILLAHRVNASSVGTGAPLYGADPMTLASGMMLSATHTAVGYGSTCNNPPNGDRRSIDWTRDFALNGDLIYNNNPNCDGSGRPQVLPGDSGGPLLDSAGRIVGVFSGWPEAGPTNTPNETGWAGVFPTAHRNWIFINTYIFGDLDSDGLLDWSDPWPADANHTDSDGDGIIDARDYRPTRPDRFNLLQPDSPQVTASQDDSDWLTPLIAALL